MNAQTREGDLLAAARAEGRRVLFTAVRNEAPFLLEWVAYHQAIGFDTIIVACNDCDDGTDELLQALEAAGHLRHFRHEVPVGKRPQGNAARLVNEAGLIAEGDWVLWLDADEFLNVKVGEGRLDDLIAAVGDHDGALINWRVFGDGGNASFPGRFISEAFTAASRPEFRKNHEVKTLFRHGPRIEGLGLHGIYRPKLLPGGRARFLAPSGAPLDGTERVTARWLDGIDSPKNCKVPGHEAGHALAQINHYIVRTPEFFALKQARGRGWARRPAGEENRRHTEDFYETHNRNDVEDRSILRWEDAVSDRMALLSADPGVAEALGIVAARLAERLPPEPVAEPEERAPSFTLTLPGPAADMLRAAYAGAEVVLEYGSGGSSFVAMEAGARKLFTVESDAGWAARIADSLATAFPRRAAHVHHVDIGPTADWGRPADTSGFAAYPDYATTVWDRPDFEMPDVVLIDGRFRVACFLTVMLRATRPVTVLFDDYHRRPEYHWIEEFGAPVGRARRMARFEVTPRALPPEAMTRILRAFVDPR